MGGSGREVAEYEVSESPRYGTRSPPVGQSQRKFMEVVGTAPPGLQFRQRGKVGFDKS